jgi:hypothetical protein
MKKRNLGRKAAALLAPLPIARKELTVLAATTKKAMAMVAARKGRKTATESTSLRARARTSRCRRISSLLKRISWTMGSSQPL